MSKLVIICFFLFPTLTMAHPSDYPNGIDPKEAQVSINKPANSQAYEADKKSENEFSLKKVFNKLFATDSEHNKTDNDMSKKETAKISQLMKNELLKNAVSLALMGLAFMGWINYMANFDPQTAFAQIIHPAILTFLSFKWAEVFSWLGF